MVLVTAALLIGLFLLIQKLDKIQADDASQTFANEKRNMFKIVFFFTVGYIVRIVITLIQTFS